MIIQETTIELKPGEHYAGLVLDTDGSVLCHLVLLPDKPDTELTWQAAMEWAGTVGGMLPTRQEQALLYANCKQHIDPEWHWSSETHSSNASCAWGQSFSDGYQSDGHESYEGRARAVRRV